MALPSLGAALLLLWLLRAQVQVSLRPPVPERRLACAHAQRPLQQRTGPVLEAAAAAGCPTWPAAMVLPRAEAAAGAAEVHLVAPLLPQQRLQRVVPRGVLPQASLQAAQLPGALLLASPESWPRLDAG
jgi:hypothetical protein